MLPKKAPLMARSSYSSGEEFLNTGSHAIGFILALAGIFALLARTQSFSESLVVVIYGSSLALMFLSSTLYHFSRNRAHKLILRKIDHVAIYLLIAGTYTPLLLLTLGGDIGFWSLLAIWLIGVFGISFKLTIGDKYPKIGVITYATMGWFALALIYPIYQALSATAFILLVAGGLCYSLGIPFYMLKSRHYSHAIWHLFVMAGAGCHYFLIYSHVIS